MPCRGAVPPGDPEEAAEAGRPAPGRRDPLPDRPGVHCGGRAMAWSGGERPGGRGELARFAFAGIHIVCFLLASAVNFLLEIILDLQESCRDRAEN